MFKLLSTIFGGPAGAVVSFFTSWLGKAIGILSLVALIMGSATAIYFSWENAIKDAEAAKYEVAKRDDLIKNKNNEIKILQGTNQAAMEELGKLKDDNASSRAVTSTITGWIGTQANTSKDRESSDIIKETFDRLYGKQKQ